MKTLLINLILATFLIVGNIYPSIAQTPEQLYQKGLMKEEGEGALLDAIDFYNQIADNSNADESLQAKALLRIGMCYEKLGKEEAVKAYQKLVNNFPGQKSEVAIAKERLSRLILIAEKVSKAPLVPKFTKIKIPTKPGNGVMSPDGKKLAYISEKSLWVLPIHGKTNPDIAGEPVKLTESMGAWDLANMGIVWSSNGKWLAFNASESEKDDEIFIIPAKGGNPLKVTLNQQRNDIRGYDYRMSLSPNGKILAYVNCNDKKETIIYTISTEGGTPTKLTSPGTREPAFSPDGKLLAYVKINLENNMRNEVWVISSTGRNPILVNDNADIKKSPVWSPDGTMLAYLAREYKKGWANNSNELWITPVSKKGAPMGVSSKINLDNSTVFMLSGWSQDNKIGIWFSTPEKNLLYTVPSSGGQAMQITPKNSWMPDWSPDGQYLYFDGENTNDFAGIEFIPANGGTVAKIHISSEYLSQPAMPTGGISVSPDGKTIVYAGFYNNINDTVIQKKLKGSHIITIPVKGGNPFILTTNPKSDRYPVWSPDGKYIAFIRIETKTENNIPSTSANIYTIPANGETPKKITSDGDKVENGRIDWSPDGKWIGYFSGDNNIKITPSEGGDSKVVVYEVNSYPHFGLSFSPEGDKIVYSNKKKLIKVDINGKNEIEIKTGLGGIPTMPAWSPDGEKIAFCAFDEGETDLWLMEDFLPLEKLAQKEETVEKEPEGIRIRQISKESYLDDLGTASSDGKYLSCVDWGKGDLAIHNLSNGEKQLLTDNATLEEDPQKFVIGSAISKNGKLIAYSWWRPHHTFDLHIFDVENKSSRLIYKEEGVEAYPLAWLSDNKLIVIRQNRNNETSHISSFNVLDGTFHNLKSFDKRTWAQICTDPNEKYIAYSTIAQDESNSDINMLTADGKSEVPLVVHPANDKVIGWFPNRKDFLFISDRSGTWDLWSLPMDNGKPTGEAKRLYTEIGEVGPIGITDSGDCYFGFSKRNFNAYIIPVNKTTGKPDEKPGMPLAGSLFSINWSPDGQYMACVKQGKRSFELFLQDTNNGKERRLAKELLYAIGPHWSSDGNSVYIFGMDQKMLQTKGYKGGIYTVDIKTGTIKENVVISNYKYTPSVDDALPISGHVVSADKQNIYLLFQNDWIVKHDLHTGKDTILYRHSNFERGVLQLSPDGKKLLFAVHIKGEELSRLITISTQGGDEKEVCTSQETEISGSAFWSPDGKFIYFSERKEGTSLWRVNADGGKPEKVWHTDKRAESFAMHPTGKEISYTVRERTTEIRVIEGLAQELDNVYTQNE